MRTPARDRHHSPRRARRELIRFADHHDDDDHLIGDAAADYAVEVTDDQIIAVLPA
jgi:hypothetical protein